MCKSPDPRLPEMEWNFEILNYWDSEIEYDRLEHNTG